MGAYDEGAEELLSLHLVWKKVKHPPYLYEVTVGRFQVRLKENKDPDLPLYTLEMGGTDIAMFDSLPRRWEFPE